MDNSKNNPQTRIIVTDAHFGEMSYHKKFINNIGFPGTKFLCDHPFNYVEVRRHGGVNICCPQWNPAEIGNVFQESIEEIWSGKRAQLIRDSITNGDYSYCNHDTCPKIQDWKVGGLTPNTPQNLDKILNKVNRTPNHVHLVLDHSCNLACPSCRVSKITQLEDKEQQIGLNAARRVFKSMFSEPHNERKVIGMDGSGEIFSSNVYKILFETEDIFTKTYQWPNLKFALSTNGTMMTEKIQKKYNYLFEHLDRIEISIDAGNEESYTKVRVGGHWDLLWKNLDYFYSTIKDNKEVVWIWNIIIQRDNFESIPEFINLSKKYPENPPVLNYAKVLNWGTWTDEEYLNRAVHIPTHPLHSKYLEIMKQVKLQA
jgi:MoaA/NifB/PqqE/SkfB family radical SAM enzyme